MSAPRTKKEGNRGAVVGAFPRGSVGTRRGERGGEVDGAFCRWGVEASSLLFTTSPPGGRVSERAITLMKTIFGCWRELWIGADVRKVAFR